MTNFGQIFSIMKSVEEFASKHPAKAFVWLEDWLANGNKIQLSSELNWIGFAETAAGYASGIYADIPMLERLLWGSIAITVQEQLAQSTPDASGCIADAMVVRSNLITSCGNHPGDKICDSSIIATWFLQNTHMSLEEAKSGLKNGRPDAFNYDLKVIIERLKMLQHLVKTNKLVPVPELKQWLEICPLED